MTSEHDGSDSRSLDIINASDEILSSLEKKVEQSPTREEMKNGVPFTKSYLKKILAFYTAPRTKFLMECIAYVAFLLFFTYTLMFRVVAEEITLEESLLMVYFIGLLIDSIYQVSFKSSNTTCSDEEGITNCPSYNFMVPVLLAFYMLFASVLLLNLLIAIFSNVFQQVEDHSVEIWKYNIYALVVGYNEKPILPVPFSALQVMVELLVLLVRRCSNRRRKWSGNQEEHLRTDSSRSEAARSTCDRRWRDNGAELFAFTKSKTTRLEETRDAEWKIGFCESGQQNTKSEMAGLLEQQKIDAELRMARLFETHCMKNLLTRQEMERNRTVTGGISQIKSRVEELQKQMSEVLDRMQSFQQTVGAGQSSLPRLQRFTERVGKLNADMCKEEDNMERSDSKRAQQTVESSHGKRTDDEINVDRLRVSFPP
ncbi:unnamed protein product [Dicrocoelium dendriticum]|nr:unnamed protein product [Dicrocoelium dendriticum]